MRTSSIELKKSGWREFMLWLLRRRRRFRVTGNSMLPLLQPGEEVLIDPGAYRSRPPLPGEIVVAQHPYRSEVRLIKRVTSVVGDNQYVLKGDNPAGSTDSRAFGPITEHNIIGRVTSRFG